MIILENGTNNVLLKRMLLQIEGQSLNIEKMDITHVASCRIAAEGSAAKSKRGGQTITYSDTSLRCRCVDQKTAGLNLEAELFHVYRERIGANFSWPYGPCSSSCLIGMTIKRIFLPR